MKNESIQVIGLMSGTSLDGLDVCCCTFTHKDNKWQYHIDAATAYDYTEELKKKLGEEAQQMSAIDFITFHSAYGTYLGKRVNEFMATYSIKPDLIASHGHTIFHEPAKKVMFQIGDGAAIAAETKIPTVFDFRRLDIMLDGQGAPLVPIGDRHLFGDYTYCLNIGGFSNISYEQAGTRIAFDISPANYVINHYCNTIGLEYDKDGALARKGKCDSALLAELNSLDYYAQGFPKSLGREWVEHFIYPMMDKYTLSLEDKLRTFYEHVAYQIACVATEGRLLITGGGAYNVFLVERIDALSKCEIVIPDAQTIEFKEALIFAFLGTLYMSDQNSCLSSVTGASMDNIGGMLVKI
ncbi:MAG: anhydro-N-acetylmuramic acid kinase [Bacteroidaceae bacterium]